MPYCKKKVQTKVGNCFQNISLSAMAIFQPIVVCKLRFAILFFLDLYSLIQRSFAKTKLLHTIFIDPS